MHLVQSCLTLLALLFSAIFLLTDNGAQVDCKVVQLDGEGQPLFPEQNVGLFSHFPSIREDPFNPGDIFVRILRTFSVDLFVPN